MQAAKANHPAQAITEAVERLTDLFDDRVGAKWTPEQLKALGREGEERYASKVPPVYMDSRKDRGQHDKFGDLIIWKDMMAKAKEEKRPFIFISDDAKEDWWWIHRGEKLGARPELRDEFKDVSGQSFHIYEFAQFLRIAADRHPEIKASVAEIEKSLRGDEQARRRLDGAAEEKALRNSISRVEHERDMVILTLSGIPTQGALLAPSTDRSVLRERLDALNAELEAMNAALPQEMASDT